MMSERAKHILFFLAVALVYGVAAQEFISFIGDDLKLFFTLYDYPLVRLSDQHPWHPHRLIDIFYQSVWTNFYFKYIYGVFLEPLTGQQHFLDTFRQMALVTFGLGMAGLFFFSTLYVRIFVKLSFKELTVFAVLFFLLFIQYMSQSSINSINARIFVFMVGLGFLYPLVVYVLKGRNVFSEMSEYKSSALMLILCYVACFSYFHTMTFVSIGLLALAIIHCFENYKRSDFSSINRFFIKIKTEPKWLLTIILSFPVFMLASLFIAVNSNRLVLLSKRVAKDDFVSSLEPYKLDKALIILAVVFIIWAWNAYRYKIGRIDKALTFRYGVIVLSLLLLMLSFELLNHFGDRPFKTGFNYIRWLLVAAALGYGFKIMKQGWAMLPMYFLFFILTAGGVRAIVSQKSSLKSYHQLTSSSYYRYNTLKAVANLAYTFSCYGKQTAPFYDEKYSRYGWLPWGGDSFHGRRWHGVLARYTRLPPTQKKNRAMVFYFEPSIAKINNQLKALQQTNQWRCARIKNDIYRVEKLPY